MEANDIFPEGPLLDLAQAISAGNLAPLERLGPRGPWNVRCKAGVTLFLWAFLRGQLRIFRYLAENGGDANTNGPQFETILHLAAVCAEPGYVEVLLRKGADPNFAAKKVAMEEHVPLENVRLKMPLHVAVENWRVATIELLLNAGANVNAQDGFGGTPLHLAVMTNHLEIADLLLKAGARRDLPNDFGITPEKSARNKGKPEMIALLKARRAP